MKTHQRKKFEIIFAVVTALGKFLFMDYLNWRLPFILTVTIAWASYLVYNQKLDASIIKRWGFRKDNFKAVLKLLFPFGIGAVICFFVIGFITGSIIVSWHIIPILLIYPLWGMVQQFLVIALVGGNLFDLQIKSIRRNHIILITAVLFGALHYPYWWLVIGTFILALLYGYVYTKERNIYAMGLFHGWLGGIFFYTVVNRDPFVEVFGKIIN